MSLLTLDTITTFQLPFSMAYLPPGHEIWLWKEGMGCLVVWMRPHRDGCTHCLWKIIAFQTFSVGSCWRGSLIALLWPLSLGNPQTQCACSLETFITFNKTAGKSWTGWYTDMKPLQAEAVHRTKGAHIHKGAAQRQNHRVKVSSDTVWYVMIL